MDENPSTRDVPGVLGFHVVFCIRENTMMKLVLLVFLVNCGGVAVNVGMGGRE